MALARKLLWAVPYYYELHYYELHHLCAARVCTAHPREEVTLPRSDRGPSLWSTPPRSLSRTSLSNPRRHKLLREHAVASANRRSGRHECRSTCPGSSSGRALRTRFQNRWTAQTAAIACSYRAG